MNKRTRFLIIIAVLAVCFAFLWPSIKWYFLTPEEEQTLALGSRDKIREYARTMASNDYDELFKLANSDSDGELPSEFSFLIKEAKSQNSENGRENPAKWTATEVLKSFTVVGSTLEQTKALSKTNLADTLEDHYRTEILNSKNSQSNAVQLGLDLSGGMSITIKADLEAAVKDLDPSVYEGSDIETVKAVALQQAMDTLSSRIDRFGLSEPVIRQQGTDRIYIEIPGAADSDRINSIIMGKGILALHEVDKDATNKFYEYYNQHPFSTFDSDFNLLDSSIIPSDTMVLGYYTKDEYDLDVLRGFYAVKKEATLDGRHITKASVTTAKLNEPAVSFELDAEGAQIFSDFTSKHIGDQLAIVTDDKVKSAPVINDVLSNSGIITGLTQKEAENLSTVLRTAWLNVPLELESQQVIGASMGAETINQGLWSLIYGLIAVMVFMLIWYKGAGINAVIAQILNLYMMFSVLSAFNLTLSLSSIAGMILTIGMAVDANVVIFERIKDELKLGKDRAAAINAGFDHAFWAIMDSNITTFIAAIFLSQLGSGTIQGFAISLAIGVFSSVFTALFVSRLMFDFNTDVMHKKHMSISWRIK